MVEVDRGVDLLALALLMATFSDWLVICHNNVPVVCFHQRLRLMRLWHLTYLKSRGKHPRCDN